MNFSPLALEPAAHDLLSSSGQLELVGHGIDIGSVDEIDAGISSPVENGMRCRLVSLHAEGAGSQAEARDQKSRPAEFIEFHDRFLPRLIRSTAGR